MIELRWVVRRREFDPINTVRVLQYRTLGDAVWTGPMEYTRTWSDWQDVPVVAEGE